MTGERGGVSPLILRLANLGRYFSEQFDAQLLGCSVQMYIRQQSGGLRRPARQSAASRAPALWVTERRLCQDLGDDSTMNVRQTEVSTGIPISQPFVIQAQLVQDRGM